MPELEVPHRRRPEKELRVAEPADLMPWERIWHEHLVRRPEIIRSERYQYGYLPINYVEARG
jgi:hypothetical protein